jgi:hypothetical protein
MYRCNKLNTAEHKRTKKSPAIDCWIHAIDNWRKGKGLSYSRIALIVRSSRESFLDVSHRIRRVASGKRHPDRLLTVSSAEEYLGSRSAQKPSTTVRYQRKRALIKIVQKSWR